MRIAILPNSDEYLDQAVAAAGAEKVELAEAEALVWTSSAQNGFPEQLPDSIRWVQLKSAGIQPWIASGTVDEKRVWSAAVGAYSEDVAEHAVGLLIAMVRLFPRYARSVTWTKAETWSKVASLRGSRIAIIGCGSIGRAMIPVLTALGVEILAVNRSGRPVEGAVKTVTSEGLNSVLEEADHAVIAGASTPDTHYLIGQRQLELLGPEAYLINIARGDLLDPEALVQALRTGVIAGAGLDVTEPEPLPDDHTLWSLENVLVTPHVANPQGNMGPHFAKFVGENVELVRQGMPPRGQVDTARSY